MPGSLLSNWKVTMPRLDAVLRPRVQPRGPVKCATEVNSGKAVSRGSCLESIRALTKPAWHPWAQGGTRPTSTSHSREARRMCSRSLDNNTACVH